MTDKRSGRRPFGTGRAKQEPKGARPVLRPSVSRTKRTLTQSGAVPDSVRFTNGELSYRVLALLLLIVVFGSFLASPIKQLLDQEQANRRTMAQIEAEKKRQQDLKERLARWDDPDYVAAQARERLGYLKPGQTQYVIVDPEAKFIKPSETSPALEGPRRPWFMVMNDSLAAAGSVPALKVPFEPVKSPEGHGK
ncbi:septum formation initiator family protein [Actinomycetaceae bacterium TAE3-ERU4]|nr:septum formation initiator family protein [Actinomycetaceae bacterium TAE3-ERU4]